MDTTLPEALISAEMESTRDTSFVENFCLPLLLASQNSDGGWGFLPGSDSRIEPTCWALKALTLRKSESKPYNDAAYSGGLRFLEAAQLTDGSWASTLEEKTGCWVTSLACWVLAGTREEKYSGSIAKGLRWICEDWPRDSSWFQRWLRKLSPGSQHSKQSDWMRGWGWTPGTSSWVEPTAFALLALERDAAGAPTKFAGKRKKLAEAMLYDRMCLGGGWNCGNPEVYGVAGEPLVIPTSWALLALRQYHNRRENRESLAWLEKNLANVQGPGSYALARICLASYGRILPMEGDGFREYHSKNESLRSIQVAAWMVLATRDSRTWLNVNSQRHADTGANAVVTPLVKNGARRS